MKRSTLAIILVVVALGLGGLFVLASQPNDEPGTSTTTESTSENQQTTDQDTTQAPETSTDDQSSKSEVEIEDFAFGPADITVKSGTTVTWTNRDSAQHSVVPDEETEAFEASDLLSKDASYSFTFETPGTYTYHCGPHPNMTGTVTVTE